jgi:hypothetical protein
MPHDDNMYFNEVRHLFLAEKNPDSKELSFGAAVEKLAKKFEKMSKKVEMEEYTNGTLKFIKRRTEQELDIRKIRRDELNSLNKILQIQYENMASQMAGIKTDERNLKSEIQILAEDLFADAQLNQEFADKKRRILKGCKKEIKQNMLVFNDIDEDLKNAKVLYEENINSFEIVEKEISEKIAVNIEVTRPFIDYLDRILEIFVRGSPENFDLGRCLYLNFNLMDLTKQSPQSPM